MLHEKRCQVHTYNWLGMVVLGILFPEEELGQRSEHDPKVLKGTDRIPYTLSGKSSKKFWHVGLEVLKMPATNGLQVYRTGIQRSFSQWRPLRKKSVNPTV